MSDDFSFVTFQWEFYDIILYYSAKTLNNDSLLWLQERDFLIFTY